MMSHRDALRSYRRAFRRAYRKHYKHGPGIHAHGSFTVMGERGERLQRLWAEHDWQPVEVVDAMTSKDVAWLRGAGAADDDGSLWRDPETGESNLTWRWQLMAGEWVTEDVSDGGKRG